MIKTHTLGFPRIGENRELKFALESHWRGETTEEELRATAHELRLKHPAHPTNHSQNNATFSAEIKPGSPGLRSRNPAKAMVTMLENREAIGEQAKQHYIAEFHSTIKKDQPPLR